MKPPFRAEAVGSLLRPEALKRARSQFALGGLNAAGLRAVEDQEIKNAVIRQQSLGLQAVTDGEFRRSWWHFDFLAGLQGVEWKQDTQPVRFQGITTKAESVAVTERIGFDGHPMLADFQFLQKNTKAVAKMTIPSPTVLHFRGGRAAIDRDVYPDLQDFFADTAQAYRHAVRAFYNIGCRYLQFDDTVWGYLCSPKERAKAAKRGDQPDRLPYIYRDLVNEILQERPEDMTITTHVCRGNFRSSWISEGGYEPIAQTLLAETNYDGYFLEFDSARAGGFEPLRFLPEGEKRAVLGLVTTKFGSLEKQDEISARLQEAARFAPLTQLCLSPQCGFASTEEGNILSEAEQWEKLKFVQTMAEQTWPN